MSEWPCQGGEEGGGAGGAGQRLTLPLPPIQRSLQTELQTSQQKLLRPAVFSKLENILREMQDAETGVPVRSQKLFLTSIPAAFMGYDLIEWLMDRLCIEDSLEAVHLANLLCQFGYYFPVNEQKNLLVKDDSSLYRFQSPYYWPSQHHTPDNIEYAIYLYKRAQRRRNIHGLEPGLPDYEMDALNNLKKILAGKWDFVTMQAEEQLKVAKDRKKGDKIINDSQEKAYWRVYRPPPGYSTLVENSPVPTREQRVKARRNNKELLREEVEFLKQYLNISRVRTSQVAEGLLDYTDTFVDYDPLLVGVGPSNPWMTDDLSFWEINKPIPDVPTKKRVERWAISLEDVVIDPLGVQELLAFMKKEYCHENLRFWLAVQELKRGPGTESKIKKKVKEIWEEFLSPGAGAEINIDGKTMEETKLAMKNPSRYTFDKAADHVYTLLLKKDCYPRFLRSEHYKALLANSLNPGSSRKRFFNFPVRKKPSQHQPGPSASGHPGHPAPAQDPRDFSIYGMEVKSDQECGDQSLSSSRECDEACPWEDQEPLPPDPLPRSRKVSLAAPAADYYPEHLMLMAVEGPPLAAAVALLPSATMVGTHNKLPAVSGAGGGNGGPDYSEEGESSPKISSLDPTAVAATTTTTANTTAATVNNTSSSSLREHHQQPPHRQQRHRTAARGDNAGGGEGGSSGGSARPRTSGPNRRPEVPPTPFQDVPPPASDDLPLSHLTSSSSEGGRKRNQRPTNTDNTRLSPGPQVPPPVPPPLPPADWTDESSSLFSCEPVPPHSPPPPPPPPPPEFQATTAAAVDLNQPPAVVVPLPLVAAAAKEDCLGRLPVAHHHHHHQRSSRQPPTAATAHARPPLCEAGAAAAATTVPEVPLDGSHSPSAAAVALPLSALTPESAVSGPLCEKQPHAGCSSAGRQASAEMEAGGGGGPTAAGLEDGGGENCWIAAGQDVCPWEDDSLTPTWL